MRYIQQPLSNVYITTKGGEKEPFHAALSMFQESIHVRLLQKKRRLTGQWIEHILKSDDIVASVVGLPPPSRPLRFVADAVFKITHRSKILAFKLDIEEQ